MQALAFPLTPSNNRHRCCRCCVCQCEYEQCDEVMPLPCGHAYHGLCIMQWFERNKTCPCCNKEVSLSKASMAAATTSAPPAS